MSKEQILALLFAERDKLNRAVEALDGPKRRGPSAWAAHDCAREAQAHSERRRSESHRGSRKEALGGDQGGQSAVALCEARETKRTLSPLHFLQITLTALLHQHEL